LVVAFHNSGDQLEVIDGFRRLPDVSHQGHITRLSVRVLAVEEPRALAALFLVGSCSPQENTK
jgi:hypothetical protein